MFAPNEKVVYPGHGVAKISRVIERTIGGTVASFFELEFFSKEMTILVPIDSMICSGIRKLSSMETVNDMLMLLTEPCLKSSHETMATNWNKRNKEYQCKIRTGSLYEICKIYRDLKHIATYKELSFGEKNLLDQTELLLVEEMAMVMHSTEEKVVEQLRSLFKRVEAPIQLIECKVPPVATL